MGDLNLSDEDTKLLKVFLFGVDISRGDTIRAARLVVKIRNEGRFSYRSVGEFFGRSGGWAHGMYRFDSIIREDPVCREKYLNGSMPFGMVLDESRLRKWKKEIRSFLDVLCKIEDIKVLERDRKLKSKWTRALCRCIKDEFPFKIRDKKILRIISKEREDGKRGFREVSEIE